MYLQNCKAWVISSKCTTDARQVTFSKKVLLILTTGTHASENLRKNFQQDMKNKISYPTSICIYEAPKGGEGRWSSGAHHFEGLEPWSPKWFSRILRDGAPLKKHAMASWSTAILPLGAQNPLK